MIFTTPEFVAFGLLLTLAFAVLSGTPRRVLLLLTLLALGCPPATPKRAPAPPPPEGFEPPPPDDMPPPTGDAEADRMAMQEMFFTLLAGGDDAAEPGEVMAWVRHFKMPPPPDGEMPEGEMMPPPPEGDMHDGMEPPPHPDNPRTATSDSTVPMKTNADCGVRPFD